QVLRDLEVHGRELLTVQVLEDVPPELRVTPERDQRLKEQARSLSPTDSVRLLDLVSAALHATANGAQARIQLELVLIKAASPEVDPSTAALLARIERLESTLRSDGGVRAVAVPASPPNSAPRVAAGGGGAQAALQLEQEPAPAPLLELETVATSWPAVVDVVRSQNAMLAALLADARPVAITERDLTLAFPVGAAFL